MTDPVANSARPVVVLDLLSLGRLYLQRGEVVPMLTHRHMLTAYVVTMFALVTLDVIGASGRLALELRGTVYIIAIVTLVSVMGLAIQGALLLAARRGPVRMHLSPVLLLATLCSVIAGETAFRLLVPPSDPSFLRLALLFAFHYILAEFAAAGLAHALIPAMLAELRGLPIRKLSETDPALWAEESQPEASASPAPLEGFLSAGGRSIPFAGLVHLQAEGNYVHLWSTDRHELLPGPLADLVAQLPPELGRQVHRSHWVAAGAIRAWSQEGRDITLHLSNGQNVPVAVTRRREMRVWLGGLAPRGGAKA